MKRSSLPRAIGIASAVGLLMSACSFLSVPDEVSVRKIEVDLTFGGAPPPGFSTPPAPVLSRPPVDIDPLPEPDPETPTPPLPPLCPPTTATAPEPAVASISFANEPQQGNYLFRFVGNLENEPPFSGIYYRTIESITETDTTFSYTVHDFMTGSKWTFQVEPESDDGTNTATAGLYLQRLEIPENVGQFGTRLLPFEPATPLKIAAFPILPGAEQSAQAIDVAPKSTTPIPNPLTGGPLLSPSGNAVQMTTTVGAPERFEVCESLAQAYKSNIDIQITGEYNVRILGFFYLWTQKGGWSIRDDFVVSGDLMAGNFAGSLMKIEPGDYL